MALQVTDLSFQYNSKQTFRFADIHLPETSNLLILGQSGTGKTTLLHLLAGLLRPTGGTIAIQGVHLATLSSRELDRYRGKNIGLVFQRSYFVKSLNVRDNLLLAQKLAGKPQDLEKIKETLAQMDVEHKLTQMPGELSIGEQQRVSIARAVLNSPKLILADEPTSALDDANTERVATLLENTAAACQANLVVVTHDQRLKANFKNIMEL